jgi:hypothetical protein
MLSGGIAKRFHLKLNPSLIKELEQDAKNRFPLFRILL